MNKINFQTEFDKLTAVIDSDNKPTLLLHTCCAPCLTAAADRVAEHFNVTLYYYNPNIYPLTEYQKRLENIKKLIYLAYPQFGLIEGEYDNRVYDNAVGELKGTAECGAKCDICCNMRIDGTAKLAKQLGYDYFCTTLTSSPLKNAQKLNEFMALAQDKYGVKYLPSDFKKQGGNLIITRTCDKYGIYRQHYCGCTPNDFSDVE